MSRKLKPLDDRRIEFSPRERIAVRQLTAGLDVVSQSWSGAILNLVAESVVIFSAPDESLIYVNRVACQRLGYTQQQLRRMTLVEIAPHARRENLCGSVMRDGVAVSHVQTVYRHRNGALIPMQLSVRSLQRTPNCVLVAVGNECIGSRSSAARDVDLGFRDDLTRLPNRTWLWQQLERECRRSRRTNYRYAVLFVDVDRFKEVNDSLGHLAGDRVLQVIALRLMAGVRPGDVVARYGGDEFVVVLKDVRSAEDVRRVAKRIGRRVRVAGTREGGKAWRTAVSVSIGAAIVGGGRTSATDAIDSADRAMYRAKALGRNGQFVIDESPENSICMLKFARC